MIDHSDKRPIWWKRLFVISAGVGAGVTLTLVGVFAAFFWYTNRPVKAPPWNVSAITAKYSDLYLTTGQPLVLTFRYTLENHTDRDYELPANESIYKVLADGKGLDRDSTIKWEGGTSVLAGQKVNVGIHVEYEYTEDGAKLDEKLTAFTKRRLAEIDGFAALDQVNRYEIRFPKPPDLKP
jgi:hypothetical protein